MYELLSMLTKQKKVSIAKNKSEFKLVNRLLVLFYLFNHKISINMQMRNYLQCC